MEPEKPELEDPPPPEKQNKEAISVYLAIVGFLLIVLSFVWNLVVALTAGK